MNMPTCPICNSPRSEQFKARLLNKYDVRYFYCETCGLLQTETPYWLDEAYSKAIANSDTGLVSRNLSIAKKLSALLYFLFDHRARYVDYAGGFGLLTRLMRDRGFDYYWYDPYATNFLSSGFEWRQESSNVPVMAATAFEVLEHVEDPLSFLEQIMNSTGAKTVIFSTILYQGKPPQPQDWWYYSLHSGQHISFFRRDTLNIVARRLALNFYSNGWLHTLTDRKLSESLYAMFTSRGSSLVDAYVRLRMQSKTFSDSETIAAASRQRP